MTGVIGSKKRQLDYLETVQRRNRVVIGLDQASIINFIGDLHVGAPDTDYTRIEAEVNAIVIHPYSYVIAMGDWIDGFFFNPARMEQIEQPPEQFLYMRSLIHYLSESRRLLVAFGGDHDGWAKKMGMDPYVVFSEATKAHYIQGVGYITLRVGSQVYKILAAHRAGGHSIYNKAHPPMRLYREAGEGSDIVVTAHTHNKAYTLQSVHTFGGEGRAVHYISVGSYKSTDGYSRKKGYPDQAPLEMYGQAVVLDGDCFCVRYFDDILEAHRQL